MSYSLRKSDPSLTHALRRIAQSQIDAAIGEIDDPDLDPASTVHQVRKRCKKLRGLIRLMRPGLKAYAGENAAIRDLARDLSALRDAGAMLETVAALEERFSGVIGGDFFTDVRRDLQASGAPTTDETIRAHLKRARKSLKALRDRTETWQVKGQAPDVLAGGVGLTYKRAVRAMAVAGKDGTPENFHEYRKRVKYHWYQMRLLKRVWPAVFHARIVEARHLATELGEHHDFAVFRLTVLPDLKCADKRVCEVLGGLIEAEEARLAPLCLKHGRRLFAEDADSFGERVGAYWRAWRG